MIIITVRDTRTMSRNLMRSYFDIIAFAGTDESVLLMKLSMYDRNRSRL